MTTGLFECDLDVNIALGLIRDFCDHDETNWMTVDLVSNAPTEVREFYTREHGLTPPTSDMRVQLRQKLDFGLGEDLFKKYRLGEDCGCPLHLISKYKVIVLCVLMMRIGANIKSGDLQHIRELVPRVQCSNTFAPFEEDQGFREPGKRQFLAALDSYRPGIPHDFRELSCHACGKTNKDGKDLKKCGGCQNERAAAYFCDKVCLSLGCVLWMARG